MTLLRYRLVTLPLFVVWTGAAVFVSDIVAAADGEIEAIVLDNSVSYAVMSKDVGGKGALVTVPSC